MSTDQDDALLELVEDVSGLLAQGDAVVQQVTQLGVGAAGPGGGQHQQVLGTT